MKIATVLGLTGALMFPIQAFAGNFVEVWSSKVTGHMHAAGGTDAEDGGFYLITGTITGTTTKSKLVKLLPSGEENLNFSTNGYFDLNAVTSKKSSFDDIIIHDGFIYVLGKSNFESNMQCRMFIVSMSYNGVLNPTFGTGGVAEYVVKSPCSLFFSKGLAMTSDDTLIVTSSISTGSDMDTLGVITLDLNGVVRSDFRHFENITWYPKGPKVVANQTGVWVAVDFREGAQGRTWSGGIVKLNNDGSLDTSFANNGLLHLPQVEATSDIQFVSNSIFLLNRNHDNTQTVAQYDINGNFIQNIIEDFGVNLYPSSLIILDGSYYLAGDEWGSGHPGKVFKFNQAGELDLNFFNNGMALLPGIGGGQFSHGNRYFVRDGELLVFADRVKQDGVKLLRLAN